MGGTQRGRWLARGALAIALLAVATSPRPSAGADAPAYFSYSFGARIDRIATAADGRIYLAGWTDETDLPASVSHPDRLPPRTDYRDDPGFLFVAALESDGTPLWTSYLPAGWGYTDTGIGGIAAGADGTVWLVGTQRIAPLNAFRTPAPETYDGFFARFSRDGELLTASALSDEPATWIEDVVVDPSGDAYLVGSTSARTFPGADVDSADRLDGFVCRVRADGAGVVWTRRYRTSVEYSDAYGGGLALDPGSGTLVVTVAGPDEADLVPGAVALAAPAGFRSEFYDSYGSYEIAAIRLDLHGEVLAAARLPFLPAEPYSYYSRGRRVAVALEPDGSVLVAGYGHVARLAPGLDTVSAASPPAIPGVVQRIAPSPDGRVFVVDSGDGPEWHNPFRHLHVLGPGLEEVSDAAFHRLVRTFEMGFDRAGDLVFAGRWDLPFNAPDGAATPQPGDLDDSITKLPGQGVRGPTLFRVRARGTDTVSARWTAAGDPVARFELFDHAAGGDVLLAGPLPATATTITLAGATPGELHDFTLVTTLVNGVKVADGWADETRAVAPTGVIATAGDGPWMDVSWQSPNGDATQYRVERRVGDGPWVRLDDRFYAPQTRTTLRDTLPPVADPVTYRVRAVVAVESPAGWARLRFPTRWASSAPVAFAPALRVVPLSGEFVSPDYGTSRFDLDARFTRLDGAPGAPFDPRSQEFRLLYGDAVSPNEFVLPPGDAGWSADGGVWTWSAARTLNAWTSDSEVVLSPADGTFRVRLRSDALRMPSWNRAVAVGLDLGGLAGGDVRVWTGRAEDGLTLRGARRGR